MVSNFVLLNLVQKTGFKYLFLDNLLFEFEMSEFLFLDPKQILGREMIKAPDGGP